MKNDPLDMIDLIGQAIFDKKGINILALDVREISTITDFVIIAEGNVDRHVIALGKAVIEALEQIGEKPAHLEGLQSGDWVVLDYMEVMVHLFMPGLRDKYRLEDLWKEGKIIDLSIAITPVESAAYTHLRRK
jgi:ribosome-associated protein